MKSKSILGIIAGALLYIYSLTAFILSYSIEVDQWGSDTSGSKLYIVLMLIGLIIVTFSIISLIDFNKGRIDVLMGPYCLIIIGSIGFLFFLGTGIDICINYAEGLNIIELTSNFVNSFLSGLLGAYGFLNVKELLKKSK